MKKIGAFISVLLCGALLSACASSNSNTSTKKPSPKVVPGTDWVVLACSEIDSGALNTGKVSELSASWSSALDYAYKAANANEEFTGFLKSIRSINTVISYAEVSGYKEVDWADLNEVERISNHDLGTSIEPDLFNSDRTVFDVCN